MVCSGVLCLFGLTSFCFNGEGQGVGAGIESIDCSLSVLSSVVLSSVFCCPGFRYTFRIFCESLFGSLTSMS